VSLGPDDAMTPAAAADVTADIPGTAVTVPAEPPIPAASVDRAIAVRRVRRDVLVDAVLPTILLRPVVLVFAVLAVIVLERSSLPSGSFLEIWNRWDAPHFFEVASVGYVDPARIVLFPLYPALIRLGSLVATPLVAGMTISFLFTVAAAAGLYRLIRFDAGRATARWGVLAMSVFPTAFTLVAPYSEAPFLAFTVWSFVAARQGRWPAAGLLALLAGLTRIQGAFILPALIIEYWLANRRIGRDASWLALAALGPLIYLAINQAAFGDPLFFLEAQRTYFHVTTVAPWTAFGNAWNGVLALVPSRDWVTVYLAPFVALCLLAATTIWSIVGKGSRPSYAAYTALTALSFATLSWPISVPRYLMGAFTIFIAAGWLGRRPSLGPPLYVASTLLFAICTTLFVTGHWAF
jgi:Gpi18-like mannosyltransferase